MRESLDASCPKVHSLLFAETGTALKTFPLIETTWKDWKEQYPETLVLSLKTGYLRPYHEDPYGIRALRTLGVIVGGSTKAYSFEQLKKVKTFPVRDRVGEQRVLVHFRKGIEKAWATDVEGKPVEFFLTYLRAWENFYPDSEIFEAP